MNPMIRALGRKFLTDSLRQRLRATRRRRQLPRFARAYADRMRRQFPSGHPMLPVWTDYALRTVERGHEAVRVVQTRRAVEGTRYLDVGCAYGGFPIAFALAGASDAVGLDPDAELLELAECLRQDLPCRVTFKRGDAMDAQCMSSLGAFDVITCNDVIEHVGDAWTLTRHLGAALRPGGLLCLWVPNSRAIEHVLADPHYGLFGISLLPRAAALDYYRSRFTAPYDVGEFYRLSDYRSALVKEGLTVELFDDVDVSIEKVRSTINAIDDLERTSEQRVALSGVDEQTAHRLRTALKEYVEEFRCLQDVAVSGAAQATRELMSTYAAGVWRLLGVKSNRD